MIFQVTIGFRVTVGFIVKIRLRIRVSVEVFIAVKIKHFGTRVISTVLLSLNILRSIRTWFFFIWVSVVSLRIFTSFKVSVSFWICVLGA